jgi:hypothetical protein
MIELEHLLEAHVLLIDIVNFAYPTSYDCGLRFGFKNTYNGIRERDVHAGTIVYPRVVSLWQQHTG